MCVRESVCVVSERECGGWVMQCCRCPSKGRGEEEKEEEEEGMRYSMVLFFKSMNSHQFCRQKKHLMTA